MIVSIVCFAIMMSFNSMTADQLYRPRERYYTQHCQHRIVICNQKCVWREENFHAVIKVITFLHAPCYLGLTRFFTISTVILSAIPLLTYHFFTIQTFFLSNPHALIHPLFGHMSFSHTLTSHLINATNGKSLSINRRRKSLTLQTTSCG